VLTPLLLVLAAVPSIGDMVHEAIDPCRAPHPAGEILVCRRPGAQQRFRLPPMPDRGFDPLGGRDSVSRERHRLIDGDGASQDLTRGSCSAVGASGWTGCMIKGWREADQQKGQ
jgi:hypothetical protein